MALNRAGSAENVGKLTRLRLAARVVLAGALFALLALLATRLAERSAVRLRVDWTAAAENTLQPGTHKVLESLPETVEIDVFFRAADPPLETLVIEAQERVNKLLYLLRDVSGGRVALVRHDLGGGRLDQASQTRLFELGAREVEPGGLLGVSIGRRRELLRLRGDLADFDPGDPTGRAGPPVPARLVSFRGEEALLGALLKVSRSDEPRVCFTRGHGELELDSPQTYGLSSLKSELAAQGFVVETWDSQHSASVPESCRVLAILGPEQPFRPEELAAIRTFVERGGRLVCAPGLETLPAQGSLADLLQPWGLGIAPRGLVARGQPSVTGELQYGTNACAQLWVDPTLMSQHDVTEPLRRAGRHVIFNGARALDPGRTLPGGGLVTLLRSGEGSWLDLPGSDGRTGDWMPKDSERRGPFALAVALVFPPQRAAGEPLRVAPDQRPEARVLVLGAAPAAVNGCFETNRDLLRNAFEWAASREWRVSVRAREHVERRMDVRDPDRLARTHFLLVLLLPGLALGLGLFTAWRRRR